LFILTDDVKATQITVQVVEFDGLVKAYAGVGVLMRVVVQGRKNLNSVLAEEEVVMS